MYDTRTFECLVQSSWCESCERPHENEQKQHACTESQAERENKLFIGMLPKTIDEEDLHNMFAPYGELREVHIIRGPEGSSKGCAFVKFVDRDAAMVAIEDMNDIIPPVSPSETLQ